MMSRAFGVRLRRCILRKPAGQKKVSKEPVMKKMLIIIATLLLMLGFNNRASAWIYVPDKGDTGWQTFTYAAGTAGFTGTVGFVVSNAIDNGAYSELLLDNLSQAGEGNRSFETGNLSGYVLVSDNFGTSFATVSASESPISGNTYYPTQADYLAVIQGLPHGIATSQFTNATGQAGTVGSILETGITLVAGQQFSFDWAFLGNDQSPWNDFALFYLKDQSGAIVYSEGLAQIGSASAVPIPSSVLLLGSGLLALLRLTRKGKRQVG
jgi:hypothetical protein